MAEQLEQSVKRMIDRMPLDTVSDLKKRVHGRTFKVATLCSGTDVAVHALLILQGVLSALYGATFQVQYLLAAEIVEWKRRFLLDHGPLRPMRCFSDAADIGGPDVFSLDYISGTMSPALEHDVDILFCGFECDSVSLMNSTQWKYKDCTATGSGKTGSTWAALEKFVTNYSPKALLLENVASLGSVPASGRQDHDDDEDAPRKRQKQDTSPAVDNLGHCVPALEVPPDC